jgi:hypothetical protein
MLTDPFDQLGAHPEKKPGEERLIICGPCYSTANGILVWLMVCCACCGCGAEEMGGACPQRVATLVGAEAGNGVGGKGIALRARGSRPCCFITI